MEDQAEMVEDDWQYIAIIIDRVLLIAYTFGKAIFCPRISGVGNGLDEIVSMQCSLWNVYIFLYFNIKNISAGFMGSFVIFQRVWYSKVWDGDPCLPPELLSSSAAGGEFSISLLIWAFIMFFVQ